MYFMYLRVLMYFMHVRMSMYGMYTRVSMYSPPIPQPPSSCLFYYRSSQQRSPPPVRRGSRLHRHGAIGPRWFPSGDPPFPAPSQQVTQPTPTTHCVAEQSTPNATEWSAGVRFPLPPSSR